MQRREFLTLAGGVAVAGTLPSSVHTQQLVIEVPAKLLALADEVIE
jgi:hypothetical protein